MRNRVIYRQKFSSKGASREPLCWALPSWTIERHISGPLASLLNQSTHKGAGLGPRALTQHLIALAPNKQGRGGAAIALD